MPAEAHYDRHGRWSIGATDAEGREHGPYKTYASAGYVESEAVYAHGELAGDRTEYHPDGRVAFVDRWRDGQLYDAIQYRARGETMHGFPDEVDPRVVEIRSCSRDGQTFHRVAYFDAEGREVTDTGEPVPPRPAGVDEDASWSPRDQAWIQRSLRRDRTGTRTGSTRRWRADGTLSLHEEGELLEERCLRFYHPNGQLRMEAYAGPRPRRVEYDEHGVVRARVEPGRKIGYDADGAQEFAEYETRDGDVLTELRREAAAGETVYRAAGDGARYRCQFLDDDQVWLDGDVVDDVLAGTWRTYNDDRSVRSEVTPSGAPIYAPAHAWEDVYRGFCEAMLRHAPPPALAAFDGIDALGTLDGPDGGPIDLPRVLRGLASIEPGVRAYALEQLSCTSTPYTLCPSTLASIPVVMRLLAEDGVDHEQLLAAISATAHALGEVTDEEAARDARELIVGGWPSVAARLAHGSDAERAHALSLAVFVRDAPGLLDAVHAAARAGSTATRGSAVSALAQLEVDVAPFLDDADLAVRMSAAILLATQHRADAPAAVDGVLAEALRAAAAGDPSIADLPYAASVPGAIRAALRARHAPSSSSPTRR